MSLIYARDLLKISLSEICDEIGFDRTSTLTMDILVDVCEREFRRLFQQIHQIQDEFTDNKSIEYEDLLLYFNENSQFDSIRFREFLQQFSHLKFPHPIHSFPAKKSNQFVLKIPPINSDEILQRESNQSTEYIYPWLPLFPHQTSEQTSSISTTSNLQSNVEQQQNLHQQEEQQKREIHHPLSLLTLTNENQTDDESFSTSQRVPIGKKPTRSLPTVLYRPKRLIEIEAQLAAEKAKKDSFEKENNDKDSLGNSSSSNPAPLRVTIPKQSNHNEKSSITIKKFPTNSNISPTLNSTSSSSTTINTTNVTSSSSSSIHGSNLSIPITTTATSSVSSTSIVSSSSSSLSTNVPSSFPTANEGILAKKLSQSSSSSSKNLSIHLSKKNSSSPMKNVDKINEISSQIPPISQPIIDSNKSESFALDLSKKSVSSTSTPTVSSSTSTITTTTTAKVPTLKLHFKKMSSNPSTTSNHETSSNKNPEKAQRISSSSSSSTILSKSNSTGDTQKTNLSIRTTSFPMVEKKTTDPSVLISPPTIHFNEKDLLTTTTTTQPKLFAQRISSTDQFEKVKKKKKKSIEPDEKLHQEKKMKKEQNFFKDIHLSLPNTIQYDLPPQTTTSAPPPPLPMPTTTAEPEKTSNPSGNSITAGGGGIKLKIKLGKPTNSTEKSHEDSSTTSNPISIPIQTSKTDSDLPPPKPTSLKLTIPRPPPPPTSSSSSSTTTADHSLQMNPSSSSSSTTTTTTTTITPPTTKSSNRRKSSTVKRIIPLELSSESEEKKKISIDDDLGNSLDDLPLGERTSPSKMYLQPTIEIKSSIDPISSTPMKKKSPTVKKKTVPKKSNQNFGLAVIEEKRIHQDSQEKVWICPSCNRPDNGQEAMIACDLCDDWYHWECVGICEEPDESTKWYCPKCHRSNSSTSNNKSSTSTKSKKQKNSTLPQLKTQ